MVFTNTSAHLMLKTSFILGNDSMIYPVQGSTLYRWASDHPVSHSILSALLTTIISFQITTIVFEISFGLKAKGKARLKDLHLKLLANEASPLKAADSILRCNWFTRLTRSRHISQRSAIVRDKRNIQLPVIAKLLALLFVGPVANIITIALCVERETQFTFEDLGVLTLQFGFTDTKIIKSADLGGGCAVQRIEFHKEDSLLTNFLLCRTTVLQTTKHDLSTNPDFKISVSFYKDLSINLLIESESKKLDWQLSGLMLVKEGRFRVRPSFDKTDLRRFANLSKNLLERKCNSEKPEDLNITNSNALNINSSSTMKHIQSDVQEASISLERSLRYPSKRRQRNLSKREELTSASSTVMDTQVNVSCKHHISGADFLKTADEIREHVRFVNGSSFTVVREDIIERLINTADEDKILANTQKGEKLTLTIREWTSVSLCILFFLSGFIVFLRILSYFLCHDDLLLGIENVLRDHFRVGCFDSMLQRDDLICIDQPAGVTKDEDLYDPEDYDSEI